MIVPISKILTKAKRQGYAVGAFNTSNLEITLAIVRAAVAQKSPVIIQTSQSAIKYSNIETLFGIMTNLANTVGKKVPIAIHLDHGKDFSMSPGEQVRDYIPVEDVVEDILFACEREDITREQPSLSNVGSGNPVTMRKFAEKWWKQLNATGNLKIGELPYREYESMRVVPQLDDSQNKHIARSDLENL